MATSLGNQSYAWWVGTDGNVWANIGGVGVRNLGAYNPQADGSTMIMSYADPNMPSDYLSGAKRISNPTATTPTTTTTNANAAPAKSVNTAAVGATQQAIDSLGTEESVANQNIDDNFNSLIGGYDAEAGRNETDYNENTVTNNQNLEKNTQNAYVAAAQGRRGLRGTLSAIGALGGTGGELADRAVTEEANRDIGGARDTATTNAGKLDKAIGRFREDDKQRRDEAAVTRENQRIAKQGDIASKKQSFYQKMAQLYSDGGNDAKGNEYLAMAGGLNNEIAQKTRVNAPGFAAKAAAFAPGSLEAYLAGAQDMTVKVADGGTGAPTLLAGNPEDPTKKRKDRVDAVAAPAV